MFRCFGAAISLLLFLPRRLSVFIYLWSLLHLLIVVNIFRFNSSVFLICHCFFILLFLSTLHFAPPYLWQIIFGGFRCLVVLPDFPTSLLRHQIFSIVLSLPLYPHLVFLASSSWPISCCLFLITVSSLSFPGRQFSLEHQFFSATSSLFVVLLCSYLLHNTLDAFSSSPSSSHRILVTIFHVQSFVNTSLPFF